MLDSSTSSQPIGSKGNVLWAWVLLIVGCISFLSFLCAAVLSKLLPPFENPIISGLQNDRYYCMLLPITLPVHVVAVYLHWLSMKLAKHT